MVVEVAVRKQVALTKRARKVPDPRRLTAVPQHAIGIPAARNALYKPTVSTKWLYVAEENFFPLVLTGSVFGSVMLLPATIVTAVNIPAVTGFIIAAGAGAQALWAVPAIILGLRWRRGRQRNFSDLLTWLHDRYGITLNAKQGLYKHISEQHVYSHTKANFYDDRGRRWVLRANYGEERYVTELDSNSEYDVRGTLPTGREATKALRVDRRLPKDLLALHMQVQQRVQKLNSRNLAPESQHVVERAITDSMQIVDLYGDLHELGAVGGDQQAQMRQVLTQLLAELGEVLEVEVQRTLNAMTVESNYVGARKKREGINLPQSS